MQPFVALDFETANEQRRSACAVGLVRFDNNGQISERFHQLIKPHPEVSYFSPINTTMHGIFAADVASAPQWDEVSAQVDAFIGDLPIVAHYMAFDGYVLSDLTTLYGLKPLTNRRFCTHRLAQNLFGATLKPKNLVTVYNHYFSGETFAHHDALADAKACGRIFAQMQQDHGYDQVQQLCPPVGPHSASSTARNIPNQLQVDELLGRYGESAALQGETVVITGTLQSGKRASIKKLVTTLGAKTSETLNKHTTILVVGIPNPSSWVAGATGPKKLLRAAELRDAGVAIRVISEEEFYNILSD